MSINISLVFPVYSQLTSLYDFRDKAQLISFDLLSQIEIIVINDHSPYLTEKDIKDVMSEIPSTIKNKYLKLLENKGPGYVRNLGIKKSSSKKYITFIDDDDRLNIKEILYFSNIFNTDIVISPINSNKKNIFYNRVFNSNIIFWILYFLGFIKTVAWNKIYKRNFLIAINANFSELRLFEDEKFIIHLMSTNVKRSYSFIDKPIVEVNKRFTSRSRSFKFKYLITYLQVQFENLNFLIRYSPNQLIFWLFLFFPKSLTSVLISYVRSFYLRRLL